MPGQVVASQRALEQLTIDTGVWLDEQCADDVGDLRSDATVRRGEGESMPVVSERLLAAQTQLRRLAEEGDRPQGPPDGGQEQPARDSGSAGEQSGGAGRLSPLSAFE